METKFRNVCPVSEMCAPLGFTALVDWMNGCWLDNNIDVKTPLEKCKPLYSLDHTHRFYFCFHDFNFFLYT